MTTASELIALRNYLTQALDPTDITALNIHTITRAAEPALARGWTGREIAANAVAGCYVGDVENIGAYITAGIRELAQTDPPRDTTPTPPPIRQVLADIHTRNTPAPDPHHWANHIRTAAT